MMSFRDHRLEQTPLVNGTVWLLTDVAGMKGRQEGLLARSPELIERLRESALVQSAESSNRIEGVEVAPGRIEPLVLGDARPRDRSEEEVLGYRRALSLVHDDSATLPINPETILRLHALAQEGAGDAGQWKRRDNEIVEFPAPGGGAPVVRFTPTPAARTPDAMAELCRWYAHAVDQRKAHPLVATAAVVRRAHLELDRSVGPDRG
jgi:Fic family protein